MANLTYRDSARGGVAGSSRSSACDDTPRNDVPGVDEELRAEMGRLAAANSELMHNIRARHESSDEVARLRAENAELRSRMEEVEKYLEAHGDTPDTGWEQRQREYEALLEEKSEVIRGLHLKLHELQELLMGRSAEEPLREEARREQASETSLDEVEELKRQLEEERRRLQEDEESLMTQMRDMELALSRDRAELSRQRSEIQRMHAELNRELEQASKDSGLRERLLSLTRRQQEYVRGKSAPVLQAPPAAQQSSSEPPPPAAKGSGFFRRLFGG